MFFDPLSLQFGSAVTDVLEHGTGYAVKNPEGKFFCGFEDADGALVFGNFVQNINSSHTSTREAPVNESGEAVFLSLAEMKEAGICAAVYTRLEHDAVYTDFAPDVFRGCRAIMVSKDATRHENDSRLDKKGLATPEACAQGVDHGHYNLLDDVRAVRNKAQLFFVKMLG